MATQSITQFPALPAGQVASNDLLPIVDVSDLASPGGTTKKLTVDSLLAFPVPEDGRTVTNLPEYLANNSVFNVKDFGAMGDGTTDDTPAIQAAIAAAAASGIAQCIIQFDAGVFVLDIAGDSGYGFPYAVNVTGDSPIIQGVGSRTIISTRSHEAGTLLFKLNDATGDVIVRDLQLASPAPVNATHQGPYGLSIGQMGHSGTAPGTLESLTVERVRTNRLESSVHGMGSKVVRIRECEFTQAGGGLDPIAFANIVNVGSDYNSAYRCRLFDFSSSTIVPDIAQGCHSFYLLGAFDVVVIDGFRIFDSRYNPLKFFGALTTDPDWPSDAWEVLTISNGQIGGVTDAASDACISLSNNVVARNVMLRNITATPDVGGSATQKRLIYCEWACQLFVVDGCVAENTTIAGITCVDNVSLSNSDKCLYVVANSNFDGYNSLADGTSGVQFSASTSSARFLAVRANRSASGSGPSFNNANTGDSRAVACTSDQLPLWLSDISYYATHADVGNTWDPIIAPTLQNSWVNFGSDYQTVGYAKEGAIVRARGMIKSGTVTSGTLLFALAAGFRPAGVMQFPCFNNTTGSTVNIVRVQVNVDGTVTLGETLGGAGWLDLSPVGFTVGG